MVCQAETVRKEKSACTAPYWCAKLPFLHFREDLSMKSDIEIAQEAKMKPIAEIAASLGLADEDVIPYGRYKAKIDITPLRAKPRKGRLILVTAINPTPAGEGNAGMA